MKKAIVGLTRGYAELDGYAMLVERNKAICKFINSDNRYPLILFHEGNINLEHQDYIKSFTPAQDISFVDISHMWNKDYGYESMCKFYTFYIWDYCKDFDHILRIDEDCTIINCEEDPFDQLKNNVFITPIWITEPHEPTNKTLPFVLEKYLKKPSPLFYNHKFPYTNVFVSDVKFWLKNDIFKNLNNIVNEKEFIENRWGDMPILGSFLNVYSNEHFGNISKFTYIHHSHNHSIINS
jgi:hypothetical protein